MLNSSGIGSSASAPPPRAREPMSSGRRAMLAWAKPSLSALAVAARSSGGEPNGCRFLHGLLVGHQQLGPQHRACADCRTSDSGHEGAEQRRVVRVAGLAELPLTEDVRRDEPDHADDGEQEQRGDLALG
jgi:hypothetical protein